MNRFLIIFLTLLCVCQFAFSQRDTVITNAGTAINSIIEADSLVKKDTAKIKKHSPRKAALRSAILPGWGQAYNKKYWKLPIVYGALGTTAYVFNFNLVQYKRIQYAYSILINRDTSKFSSVDADLQPFIKQNATNALRNYRNEYRKNIDYSVLIFLLFWGLNVVDATVDAHLKGFDVSDDLSLKIKPGFSPSNNTAGLSLVFDIHKGKKKRSLLL